MVVQFDIVVNQVGSFLFYVDGKIMKIGYCLFIVIGYGECNFLDIRFQLVECDSKG